MAFVLSVWCPISPFSRSNLATAEYAVASPQKADAELAYELQAAKEKQKIRLEEIAIDIIERKKQIEVRQS